MCGHSYGTSIPFIIAQGDAQINLRAAEVAAKTPMHNITLVGGVLANETNPLYVKGRKELTVTTATTAAAAAAAAAATDATDATDAATAASAARAVAGEKQGEKQGAHHGHSHHEHGGGHTHGKAELVELHGRLGSVLKEVTM